MVSMLSIRSWICDSKGIPAIYIYRAAHGLFSSGSDSVTFLPTCDDDVGDFTRSHDPMGLGKKLTSLHQSLHQYLYPKLHWSSYCCSFVLRFWPSRLALRRCWSFEQLFLRIVWSHPDHFQRALAFLSLYWSVLNFYNWATALGTRLFVDMQYSVVFGCILSWRVLFWPILVPIWPSSDRVMLLGRCQTVLTMVNVTRWGVSSLLWWVLGRWRCARRRQGGAPRKKMRQPRMHSLSME